MRTIVAECLLRQILVAFDTLATAVGGISGGGGGTAATKITSPDVSTYNDSRGVVGDWSFNETLDGGTRFEKVSIAPHKWISWSVAQS